METAPKKAIKQKKNKQQKINSEIAKSSKNGLRLVDLPEEILRNVFGYLTDADIYFNVRRACKELENYVDDYVQLGKSIK